MLITQDTAQSGRGPGGVRGTNYPPLCDVRDRPDAVKEVESVGRAVPHGVQGGQWRWEVWPLTFARARLLYTDGTVVDGAY